MQVRVSASHHGLDWRAVVDNLHDDDLSESSYDAGSEINDAVDEAIAELSDDDLDALEAELQQAAATDASAEGVPASVPNGSSSGAAAAKEASWEFPGDAEALPLRYRPGEVKSHCALWWRGGACLLFASVL